MIKNKIWKRTRVAVGFLVCIVGLSGCPFLPSCLRAKESQQGAAALGAGAAAAARMRGVQEERERAEEELFPETSLATGPRGDTTRARMERDPLEPRDTLRPADVEAAPSYRRTYSIEVELAPEYLDAVGLPSDIMEQELLILEAEPPAMLRQERHEDWVRWVTALNHKETRGAALLNSSLAEFYMTHSTTARVRFLERHYRDYPGPPQD